MSASNNVHDAGPGCPAVAKALWHVRQGACAQEHVPPGPPKPKNRERTSERALPASPRREQGKRADITLTFVGRRQFHSFLTGASGFDSRPPLAGFTGVTGLEARAWQPAQTMQTSAPTEL